MGPGVSKVLEMGQTPYLLTKPNVGFIPAKPQRVEGEITEPEVSVPTETTHSPAATATPEPELEPLGVSERL